MASTNDIGNRRDLHLTNKQEACRRLALQALAKTYGKKGLLANGPVLESVAPQGNCMVLLLFARQIL